MLSTVLPFFAFGSILIYRRIKSYEHAGNFGVDWQKKPRINSAAPISALLAWTELLDERSRETEDEVLAELSTNMQSDLERLQKNNYPVRNDRHGTDQKRRSTLKKYLRR